MGYDRKTDFYVQLRSEKSYTIKLIRDAALFCGFPAKISQKNVLFYYIK